MIRPILAFATFLMLASCASTPSISPTLRAQMAPTGVLRAAVNFGNVSIAQKDPAGGDPRGVGPDIARDLARRLGAPIRYVTYDTAGKVAFKSGRGPFGFKTGEMEQALMMTLVDAEPQKTKAD